jgi:hypothetical protein
MNNIYENKVKKYKIKYLKLLGEGGGLFWNSDEEKNVKKELEDDLKKIYSSRNNILQKILIIKEKHNNIFNNKQKAIEKQKTAETLVNILKENLNNKKYTCDNLNKEIILYENLYNYNKKIYVLQLELYEISKEKLFRQMLLEEVEVLIKEISKAKDKVNKQSEEEAEVGLNEQLVEALELALNVLNAKEYKDKKDKEDEEKKDEDEEYEKRKKEDEDEEYEKRKKEDEEKRKKEDEEKPQIQEKIVLMRTLKKAIQIVEKEKEIFVKNYLNKSSSYININNLSLNKKIELLNKLYKENKKSYIEEEEKLVNAEKTEQEAYTEYNDLIIKDKENIKEYEEEKKNLIIIEKSIEKKLKDIKK